MITPEEIRSKALKLWNSRKLLRSWIREENLFPLRIPFTPPDGRALSDRYQEVRQWISLLVSKSKTELAGSYSIGFRTVNNRRLGTQKIPREIRFDELQDLLAFIGKEKAFRQFQWLAGTTKKRLPQLESFLLNKPHKALGLYLQWEKLLTVCEYFIANPRPGQYIRQLDIHGIDTKFIEQHKPVLAELLDMALPETAVNAMHKRFEQRFGLKYDEPTVRFRILDTRLTIAGLSDLSLPLSQFKTLQTDVDTVFITENKINGLSFPEVNRALVIFGLGYGVQMLAEVDWLPAKSIYYWGDIDTHGFAILSQLRSHLPQTRSLLMDEKTLLTHRSLWVVEPEEKRFVDELKNLTGPEQELFTALRSNSLGTNIRLEQERIQYEYVMGAVLNRGDVGELQSLKG
ncbi:MAG TPA: hypothetical protein ENG83_01620 [Nitrospirae bacterium]|nr:hypothetical protein BMS3Abin06_02248 [bacterium BMS3Abin06]HDH10899.1 hypothetical protein [Nitrospirota bacterium]HDZ02686.1 hypothetical protein [Nitrospirota bacterium]